SYHWFQPFDDARVSGTKVACYEFRYLSRPVIALNRIDSYDEVQVTFHYNRHEDNAYVRKTIPALDFVRLLIQHIPDKNFKMTRYYGLYARHRETDKALYKAVSKSKYHLLRSFTKWRNDILLSYGYAPLNYPNCRHERAMAKAKCRSA
ncbi:MAG: transposase, partial [Butyricicoccus sp.]|nr:transposase [Butyricicoccus sp.]